MTMTQEKILDKNEEIQPPDIPFSNTVEESLAPKIPEEAPKMRFTGAIFSSN